jgi:polyphosphate kinase
MSSEETMAIDLPDFGDLPSDRFLDRELSWLAFNQRVLELAEDSTLPLLERVNFLAIFASNLDEFFMVRVAGLKRRIATGLAVTAASGLEPQEVLTQINQEAHRLQLRNARLFHDEIEPALRAKNITLDRWNDLSESEREKLSAYFDESVLPVLTPLAVDPAHPFPYISGLSLNIAVVLRGKDGQQRFSRLKVPPTLSRFVQVPDTSSTSPRFIALESIIERFLGRLYPGMEVLQTHAFRVTRNEDLEVDEDESENLLESLEKELLRRRFGPPVRLEVADDIQDDVLDLLIRELDISQDDVFRVPAPLDLTGLFQFAGIRRPELHYAPHQPVTQRSLSTAEDDKSNIFRVIREREILVHHPYERFSTSTQAFLEQAAADPKVLAIKQTLYRTSGDSPIVDALIDAAEAGKQVLALVEIKARFDEQANISWAKKLEAAGVHVVYGIVGLKTHCKLSLVIRQEGDTLRRYCHIGTGNYNPKTARFYEDYGLLTARQSVGEDLTRLFNMLSGYAPEAYFKTLLVSPNGVRDGLVERIQAEINHQLEGRPSGIRIKVNALVDEQIIDALYRASMAGVPVEIFVRGMCSLKPGVPGLSDTIKVRSVLGRYLEHSRAFAFVNGGDPRVYIGSADMMHRNLDRRVEALVNLVQPDHLKEIEDLFDLAMSDDASSWHLDSNGTWTRKQFAADGRPLIDVQEELMRRVAGKKRH